MMNLKSLLKNATSKYEVTIFHTHQKLLHKLWMHEHWWFTNFKILMVYKFQIWHPCILNSLTYLLILRSSAFFLDGLNSYKKVICIAWFLFWNLICVLVVHIHVACYSFKQIPIYQLFGIMVKNVNKGCFDFLCCKCLKKFQIKLKT